MDLTAQATQFVTLAGTLRPSGDATPDDLQAARSALAASLKHLSPQPPGGRPIGPVPFAQARDVPVPSATGIDGSSVAATASPIAGMAATTLGPFIDPLGQTHWIDIVPLLSQVTITRAGATGPALTIPVVLPAGVQPTSLTLGAGTLWIASALIAPGAPAGGFTGLLISGGTIDFSAPPTLVAGNLQIAAGDTMTLTVTLAAVPGPTGGTGPGADGGAVVADFPAQVSFRFAPAGGSITAAGPAALTVYSQRITMQWHAGPPVFEPLLQQILVPMTPPPGTFTPGPVQSKLCQPAGRAPITGAAWALPVAVIAASQLGSAAGTGALLVALGAGMRVTWSGLSNGPARPPRLFLLGAAGGLEIVAPVGRNVRLGTTVALWPQAGPASLRSSVDVAFPANGLIAFFSIAKLGTVTETEVLGCGCIATAHLDRPLGADGSRLGPTLPGAFWITETASAKNVTITAVAAPVPLPKPIAIALSNALMVATPPLSLLLIGRFATVPTALASGGMALGFRLIKLLPTLPDPYAANFLPSGRLVDRAVLAFTASILWAPGAATTLGFALPGVPVDQIEATPPTAPQFAVANAVVVTLAGAPVGGPDQLAALATLFHDSIGAMPASLFMLDVSSNIDQFGVGIVPERVNTIAGGSAQLLEVAGMDLIAQAANLRAFTVPQVQWEPVINIPNPNAPFPSPVAFRDDGGPTLLGSDDVTLVPVTPAAVLDRVVASYQGGTAAAAALFTLPFGMAAVATLAKRPPPGHIEFFVPSLTPVQPVFPTVTLTGGRQISLTAGLNMPGIDKARLLPGATVQLRNLADRTGAPLAPPISILGPNVDGIFDDELRPGGTSPGVPLVRIDLSGYGESSFSSWVDQAAKPLAVTQVKFNIMLGRASHEVVQVKSILYPWGAIVVRTITIERQDNAELNRSDSGWVAATPGVFATSVLGAGIVVHPGAVGGAYNIREIRDTTQSYPDPPGPVELRAVYFDADIQIAGVVSGGRGGLVPSIGQLGYVKTAGTPIDNTALAALIASRGPFGGPVDCVIDVGGSQQPMRVSRVEVANAPDGGTAQFAAVARGSLTLPAQGSWSIVLRTDTVSEPAPLDPDFALPLIRAGAAGQPATGPWRFADAADLAAPAAEPIDYCLLHTTNASSMLFPRPKIETGSAAITSTVIPLLADGFALMESVGIMPRQDGCLQFPDAGYALGITGPGALTLDSVPVPFGPSLPGRTLASSALAAIALEYANENATPCAISVAIAPNAWSVGLQQIGVRLDMNPFDGLMRTVGDLTASSTDLSHFANPRLVLSPDLQALELLLTFLEAFGLPEPFTVTFSNGGWAQSTKYKLKAGITFNLPVKIPNFTFAVAFKLGFGNTAGSTAALLTTTTSQWLAYFNFKGTLQVPVFPLVKVGGVIIFKIETDFANGTLPENDKLTLQLGVIITVGGDLVPHVVKLQASVTYAFMLVVVTSTPKSIGVGVAVIISATGQVLSGLIGISFTAEADGLVIFTPLEVQVTLDIQVDVTVCWFLNFNLDEQIQYTKTLP